MGGEAKAGTKTEVEKGFDVMHPALELKLSFISSFKENLSRVVSLSVGIGQCTTAHLSATYTV